MSDPPRLCDDHNPRIAALLRAAQHEPHPERDLEKALAAVGSGGALIGVSQSAAAATAIGKVGFWSLAKWTGAGLVSGLVTVGGAHVAEQMLAPAPDPAASVTEKVEQRVAAPEARPERVSEAPPGAAVTLPAQRAAPIARNANPVATPAAGSTPKADPVTVEVLLIDEARRALAGGRAQEALATLARYRREAPTQRLAPEARYLEMEAYLAIGDTAAARRAAQILIERHPGAPHTARARWVLGDRKTNLADH